MKQIALILALASFAAAPVAAQETDGDMEEGFNLLEEGAKLFLRGLMDEMEPAIDDLRDFAQEVEPALREMAEQMGPALSELLEKVDDFRNYDAPEIMPNGDIIIRRKPDAPDLTLPEDGAIEL